MALGDRLKNIKTSDAPEIVEEIPFTEYITDALSQKISTIPVWYDYDYAKQFELILNFLDSKLNSEFEDLSLSDAEKKAIAEDFLKTNNGFGILDKLLARDEVLSVMVTSFGTVYTNKSDKYIKTDLVLTRKQFNDIADKFDCSTPFTGVRKNNFLITIIKPPVADNVLIIQKLKDVLDTVENLTEKGSITKEVENILKYLINNKKNIIVAAQSSYIARDFIHILINSIPADKRVVMLEDNGLYRANLDNVSSFSAAGLCGYDYENLLSTVLETNPDYITTEIKDYKKFEMYYLNIDNVTNGLITQIIAQSCTDVSNKLVNFGVSALKSTEKQAKLKFSSTYDYIIFLDKTSDESYVIESIMEISSTKTSSLVLNEVVKFVDGIYALDFPKELIEAPQDTNQIAHCKKDLKSFRERLKEN